MGDFCGDFEPFIGGLKRGDLGRTICLEKPNLPTTTKTKVWIAITNVVFT